MKKLIRRAVEQRGYRLEKVTEPPDLEAFFASVRPVADERGLVRVGASHDGGYLVPDDLEGIAACFSPGVADTASFEEQLAGLGIPSFLADGSVNAAPVSHERITFEQIYLGDRSDAGTIRLEEWVGQKSPAIGPGDLLLQMDIEGAEYRVFLDTPRSVLRRFRILVVEFHGMDRLFDRGTFPFLRQVFDKLLEDFEPVHIHPNNRFPLVVYGNFAVPPLLEMSFLRKDRVRKLESPPAIPHPLDAPNVKDLPDIVLPGCWLGKGTVRSG